MVPVLIVPGLLALVVTVYLLLALGAHPYALGWRFEWRMEAVGVVGAGAGVALLQLTLFLTHGAVVVMLQLLLTHTHTQR